VGLTPEGVPTAAELGESLDELLEPVRRVRVLDREAAVIADVTGAGALAALKSALRLDPDSVAMAWMGWPDLRFQFLADDGRALVSLGLLSPEWLRWDPYGDRELADPAALAAWLAEHAPPA
jgi:hypothetical protein